MLQRPTEKVSRTSATSGKNESRALANVDGGCMAMARRHAVIQAFQFDPESDPDGEAPEEEVATQRLQQDVSEYL